MAVSDATWLDQQGRIRLVGQLSGDFGGLPTGWTEDASDPANVSSNGGTLDLDGSDLSSTGGAVRVADVILDAGGAISSDNFAEDVTGVGFYGTTPVAQAAAPVTLGDVIAALKALGLVAT